MKKNQTCILSARNVAMLLLCVQGSVWAQSTAKPDALAQIKGIKTMEGLRNFMEPLAQEDLCKVKSDKAVESGRQVRVAALSKYFDFQNLAQEQFVATLKEHADFKNETLVMGALLTGAGITSTAAGLYLAHVFQAKGSEVVEKALEQVLRPSGQIASANSNRTTVSGSTFSHGAVKTNNYVLLPEAITSPNGQGIVSEVTFKLPNETEAVVSEFYSVKSETGTPTSFGDLTFTNQQSYPRVVIKKSGRVTFELDFAWTSTRYEDMKSLLFKNMGKAEQRALYDYAFRIRFGGKYVISPYNGRLLAYLSENTARTLRYHKWGAIGVIALSAIGVGGWALYQNYKVHEEFEALLSRLHGACSIDPQEIDTLKDSLQTVQGGCAARILQSSEVSCPTINRLTAAMVEVITDPDL